MHGLIDRRDRQLSAQIKTVIVKKVEIKHSSVDIAPTLGVNHVISGVVVLVLFSYVRYALINIYI